MLSTKKKNGRTTPKKSHDEDDRLIRIRFTDHGIVIEEHGIPIEREPRLYRYEPRAFGEATAVDPYNMPAWVDGPGYVIKFFDDPGIWTVRKEGAADLGVVCSSLDDAIAWADQEEGRAAEELEGDEEEHPSLRAKGMMDGAETLEQTANGCVTLAPTWTNWRRRVGD
jgi:hypothetical protein